MASNSISRLSGGRETSAHIIVGTKTAPSGFEIIGIPSPEVPGVADYLQNSLSPITPRRHSSNTIGVLLLYSFIERANDLPMATESTHHVLVVDQDRYLVAAIAEKLESNGLRVTVSYDANEALAFALVKSPDLILMNLSMPKRSAFLVMEYLLRECENAIPHFVIMTDIEGQRHRDYAEILGVADYLLKPLSPIDALNCVLGILPAPTPDNC